MVVKCQECGKQYERFDVGDYGNYKCGECNRKWMKAMMMGLNLETE